LREIKVAIFKFEILDFPEIPPPAQSGRIILRRLAELRQGRRFAAAAQYE
jgi:hypothetical protein